MFSARLFYRLVLFIVILSLILAFAGCGFGKGKKASYGSKPKPLPKDHPAWHIQEQGDMDRYTRGHYGKSVDQLRQEEIKDLHKKVDQVLRGQRTAAPPIR